MTTQETHTLRFIGTRILPITITVKTGLHIGGTNDVMRIGSGENEVIKDMEGNPYIPGSSLKGKIRSILEARGGKMGEKGGPHTYSECPDKHNCAICRFFGVAGYKKESQEKDKEDAGRMGPTRLLFRDLVLHDTTKEKFDELRKMGVQPLENKTEIAMNRRTGTALGGALRPFERVPAGALFTGEMVIRMYDVGAGMKSDETLIEDAFGADFSKVKTLLEEDCLGAQGSRGSGQIIIDFTKSTEKKGAQTA